MGAEQQTRARGNGCNHGATDASTGGAGASAGQRTREKGWANEGKGKG